MLTALDGSEWSASDHPLYPGEEPPPIPPRIHLQEPQSWYEGSNEQKNLCSREELNPDCLVVWIRASRGIKSCDLGGHSIKSPQSVHSPYDFHFITGATLRHVSNTPYAAQYDNEQATDKLRDPVQPIVNH
jgi:hypothetical protein